MGKVLMMDREMGKIFELIDGIRTEKIRNIAVVVTKEDSSEEFFFCGHPGNIYQSLALATGHLLQNFQLMEDPEMEEIEDELE